MSVSTSVAAIRSPLTRRLLDDPILPTLLRLAWPNVVVMVMQSSVGLIEAYFVGKLGTDALAGVTLVFPMIMLMTTMSGGAVGGGISSSIARALGAHRLDDAERLALHGLVISLGIGFVFSLLFLSIGRSLYASMGAVGPHWKRP
jgi:Na+-driven multidrug efflux pump